MSKKENQIAIEAIRAQIQPIAFDANLWDRKIADYPWAEKCSIRRKQLLAAIDAINGKNQQLTFIG